MSHTQVPNSSGAVFQLELAPSLPKHYELGPLQGEAAFSSVYRAKNTLTGKDVAIKVIDKLNLSQKQLANISNEIHVMNTLTNAGPHPNILRLIEAFDTELTCYIVLELCDGGEIFNKIIEYTYFSERLSQHVFYQLLDAIRFINENHIVHRDIKPENLLFKTIPFHERPPKEAKAALRSSDDDLKKDEGAFIPGVGGGCIGIIKLADFGLSKQLRYDLLLTTRASNLKTPCGTAGYTAPEVIHCGVQSKRRFKSIASRSNYYSKAVDIWSLGCFLYTVLCGFPPFYDEDQVVLTQKIIKGDFVFLEPWWNEISAEAKDLIKRMLVVNPEDRITIEEIYQHPWLANVTAPEALEYFPEHIPTESFSTPHQSRPCSKSSFKMPVTPNGEARSLLSPGIAIKQVFNNPAMSYVNLKLLEQLKQQNNVITFDEETRFGSGNVKGKLPLTPAPKDINFSKVLSDRLRFSFSDDDDDYDDDDEDDDSNEYCCESDGSFFDDYNSRFSVHARFQELDLSNCDSGQISVRSGGTPLRTKYVLLSSKSSTEWLKLTCNARETESVLRALSVISNMATDMKFSLNLNELNVIKRRMSVKSIFGAF